MNASEEARGSAVYHNKDQKIMGDAMDRPTWYISNSAADPPATQANIRKKPIRR